MFSIFQLFLAPHRPSPIGKLIVVSFLLHLAFLLLHLAFLLLHLAVLLLHLFSLLLLLSAHWDSRIIRMAWYDNIVNFPRLVCIYGEVVCLG